MFLPVGINLGAGNETRALYNRSIELTARQFEAFSRSAENMTEPLTRVGQDLHTQISIAFAGQGAGGYTGRWKPLSPTYAAWKQKHAPGTPILVGLRPQTKRTRTSSRKPGQTYRASGQMRRQLLVPLADQSTWHITPRRLLYSPLSDIAGYHQTGTDRMPARPPVDPNPTFLHSIDRTFATWVGELVDQHGL